MPSVGGKIWGVLDLATHRQLLCSLMVRPHVASVGSAIDDHFSGGWDEAFPTDYACLDRYGQQIPELGEVWTLRMEATVLTSDDGAITVSISGIYADHYGLLTREVTVPAAGSVVRVRSTIRNIGPRPVDFIWGSRHRTCRDPGRSC